MSDYMDNDDVDERDGETPLDPTLAALARDYHAPPTPPREEMWAAITRARGVPEVKVIPLFRRRPVWLGAGMAALLALAFGIGRISVPADVPALAGRDSAPAVAPASDTLNDAAGPAALPMLATDEPELVATDAEPVTRVVRRAPAARQPERASTRDARLATENGGRPDAFDVVAARHLSRSEVFLTLVRDALRGEEATELSPGTARLLLVRNRLLLDSPAADDPRMRRLLEDLELVLVQIAQLPDQGSREDTDFITDGLEAGDVLTRLRSATSTGVAATLRQGAL